MHINALAFYRVELFLFEHHNPVFGTYGQVPYEKLNLYPYLKHVLFLWTIRLGVDTFFCKSENFVTVITAGIELG